jgi:hypothetical protein
VGNAQIAPWQLASRPLRPSTVLCTAVLWIIPPSGFVVTTKHQPEAKDVAIRTTIVAGRVVYEAPPSAVR